eukprot:TRINITY_DN14959_c0_g1_i1.p1 TRINITY_DN14959_c0_g1~~TRINITY_DN14959_c0_g1_i1.p1  ORF type:complete len:885 (-),score=158.76 TRINITY_DN14959_c0_g1_i1:120-2774(-)
MRRSTPSTSSRGLGVSEDRHGGSGCAAYAGADASPGRILANSSLGGGSCSGGSLTPRRRPASARCHRQAYPDQRPRSRRSSLGVGAGAGRSIRGGGYGHGFSGHERQSVVPTPVLERTVSPKRDSRVGSASMGRLQTTPARGDVRAPAAATEREALLEQELRAQAERLATAERERNWALDALRATEAELQASFDAGRSCPASARGPASARTTSPGRAAGSGGSRDQVQLNHYRVLNEMLSTRCRQLEQWLHEETTSAAAREADARQALETLEEQTSRLGAAMVEQQRAFKERFEQLRREQAQAAQAAASQQRSEAERSRRGWGEEQEWTPNDALDSYDAGRPASEPMPHWWQQHADQALAPVGGLLSGGGCGVGTTLPPILEAPCDAAGTVLQEDDEDEDDYYEGYAEPQTLGVHLDESEDGGHRSCSAGVIDSAPPPPRGLREPRGCRQEGADMASEPSIAAGVVPARYTAGDHWAAYVAVPAPGGMSASAAVEEHIRLGDCWAQSAGNSNGNACDGLSAFGVDADRAAGAPASSKEGGQYKRAASSSGAAASLGTQQMYASMDTDHPGAQHRLAGRGHQYPEGPPPEARPSAAHGGAPVSQGTTASSDVAASARPSSGPPEPVPDNAQVWRTNTATAGLLTASLPNSHHVSRPSGPSSGSVLLPPSPQFGKTYGRGSSDPPAAEPRRVSSGRLERDDACAASCGSAAAPTGGLPLVDVATGPGLTSAASGSSPACTSSGAVTTAAGSPCCETASSSSSPGPAVNGGSAEVLEELHARLHNAREPRQAAKVWTKIGQVRQKRRDFSEARAAYRTAMRLDGTQHGCLANLAQLEAHSGNLAVAYELIQRAAGLSPTTTAYVEFAQRLQDALGRDMATGAGVSGV